MRNARLEKHNGKLNLKNQEDATISAVDFDTNSSLFGVLDGHGGKK